MVLGAVGGFWAVSLLFVMTPGADWAYAISAGVRHRTIVPAVAGLLAGHLLATAVVAAGVATLLAGSPNVLAALTLAGAAYLVWLGAGLVRAPAAGLGTEAAHPDPSWMRQTATGLGISGLNPKVLLLFLALLPQFVDPTGTWPVATQIVTLGLVHVASCAVVYTVVGTGARRVLRSRPATARVVTRVSGLAMILVGIALVVEQTVH